eukprot:jgi/Chrzof1/10731/Cz05g10110.t1
MTPEGRGVTRPPGLPGLRARQGEALQVSGLSRHFVWYSTCEAYVPDLILYPVLQAAQFVQGVLVLLFFFSHFICSVVVVPVSQFYDCDFGVGWQSAFLWNGGLGLVYCQGIHSAGLEAAW